MRTLLGIGSALFFVCSISIAQQGGEQKPLMSLVETERAFAKTSVAKGVRESFLAFFADDGIVFRPHPVRYKEAAAKTPAPANPLGVTLNWQPIFADVASSGDLGYTTGPYTLTNNGPKKREPQHGFFFSVWRKQPDGSWRVVLDAGIQTEEPYRGSTSFPPTARSGEEHVWPLLEPEKGKEMLLNAERELAKASAADGMVKAFLARLGGDARVYRPGLQPMIGIPAARTFLSKRTLAQSWTPLMAEAARSGDLGYAYGSYETREGDATPVVEKGYYVRVWRRSAKEGWRIVVDVAMPLPVGESGSE
jgi:ketosteroid isomerase-like protein